MAIRKLKNSYRGFCISLEGGEASGKSTQLTRLHEWLIDQGLPVLLTRQPGGSRIGERIREILLDSSFKELSPRAELLLYEADRAQHVAEIVAPALLQGKIVLSDRFADSSTVYQGICRDLGLNQTLSLNRFATSGLEPDLTLLLDLPRTTASQRLDSRGTPKDRLEAETDAFHRQVRAGFLELAKRYPRRIQVINARQPIEKVEKQIRKVVQARLERKGLWRN